MKRIVFSTLMVLMNIMVYAADEKGTIEVTGSSSVSVTPDRITVEIGTNEYYRKTGVNDSVKVTLAEIDQLVWDALQKASVPDSLVTISNIGNYFYSGRGEEFLMGKRISAVLTDINQLVQLSENLGFPGVTNFRISGSDNSNMTVYNRKGLENALAKAEEKAQLLARKAGGRLGIPVKIVEEGPMYYEEDAVAENVMLTADAGGVGVMARAKAVSMENLRKIVRYYNVRVTYEFIPVPSSVK